jgi:hypothetical protein
MIATLIAVCVILACGLFCLTQFLHLMARRDDEFPGRYDKPIWAAAMVFGNVFGAFAYWLSRPHVAPESGDGLKGEFSAAKLKLSGGEK